jgi:hypothetical protein
MTELYLIRHGIAEEQGEAWPDDAKRPLTQEGAAKLRKAVRALARLGVSLDVILTSPLVRTRQTAEIVAAGFDPKPHLVTADSLAPGGSAAAVIADLRSRPGASASRSSATSLASASSRRASRDRAIPFRSRRAACAASTSEGCRRAAPATCAGS